jgi:hypothetical protein
MVRMTNSLIAAMFCAAIPATALAEDGAYAALQRFDGVWNATFSTGRMQTIHNHCVRTGLFFVCEQSVDARPAALVIFLPSAAGEGALTYRTQTVDAAGDPPGPWRDLTIRGDRWTYGATTAGRGKTRRERSVNTFTGPDFIHFEEQTSTDGETWTTTRRGDERRAP